MTATTSEPNPQTTPRKVGFISLGCPKALVDSERILTQLRAEGYQIALSYEDAEVVVVNTCGFITPAIEESLGAIGEALEQSGKVIVTGCLGERPETIMARHPNVSSVTGPGDVAGVMRAVHDLIPPDENPFTTLLPTGIKLKAACAAITSAPSIANTAPHTQRRRASCPMPTTSTPSHRVIRINVRAFIMP